MELSDMETTILVVGAVTIGFLIHWMLVIYQAATEVRDHYRHLNGKPTPERDAPPFP